MSIAPAIMMSRHVAPSILSADFARLGEQVEVVLGAGHRLIHVDVMDGIFVPNITIGPLVVNALAPRVHGAGAALDVHLMISQPDLYLEEFVNAGADGLPCMWRPAPPSPDSRGSPPPGGGGRSGDQPGERPPVAREAVHHVDYVLLMSVNPGFGGQQFIPRSLERSGVSRTCCHEG